MQECEISSWSEKHKRRKTRRKKVDSLPFYFWNSALTQPWVQYLINLWWGGDLCERLPYENVPFLPAPLVNLVAPGTDSAKMTGLPRSNSNCIAWKKEYLGNFVPARVEQNTSPLLLLVDSCWGGRRDTGALPPWRMEHRSCCRWPRSDRPADTAGGRSWSPRRAAGPPVKLKETESQTLRKFALRRKKIKWWHVIHVGTVVQSPLFSHFGELCCYLCLSTFNLVNYRKTLHYRQTLC